MKDGLAQMSGLLDMLSDPARHHLLRLARGIGPVVMRPGFIIVTCARPGNSSLWTSTPACGILAGSRLEMEDIQCLFTFAVSHGRD